MKQSKSRLLLLMINAILGGLFSQNPYAIHLDQSNGLPTNAVYNILQDKKGFIWIASDKGLFRYDGSEYKPYVKKDMVSKSGSYLHEDRLGRIWYANFDGNIFFVENDSLKQFPSDPFFQHEYFMFDDYLWVNNDKNELCQYDIRTKKCLKKQRLGLFSIFQTGDVFYGKDDKGKTYIFNQEGVLIKQITDTDKIKIHMVIKSGADYYLMFSKEGVDYIGKNSDNNTPVTLHKIESTSLINSISFYEGSIMVGTRTGLYKYNMPGSPAEKINHNNIISCVITDKNNCLWVSTINDGIFIYPLLQNQYSYTVPSSSCHLKNIDNTLYLYDANGAVRSLNDKSGSYDFLVQLEDFNRIYDFSKRTAEYADITEYRQQSYSNFRIAKTQRGSFNLMVGGLKKLILLDHKYVAYAATGVAGLVKANKTAVPSIWDNFYESHKLQKGKTHNWTEECPVIISKRIKSVAHDNKSSQLYFVSNDGIYSFSPNSGSPSKILLNGNAIYADDILAEQGSCIALLTNGELLLIKEKQASLLKNVNSLDQFLNIKLINGEFVFTGTQKIYKIPAVKISSNTGEKDLAVMNLQVNTYEINDIAFKDGHYFISTVNSLIKYKFQPQNNNIDIPFYINYLDASGERYNSSEKIEIPSGKNDILINFSILNYLNNRLGVFYRINNDPWKTLSPAERNISFASLSPGSYYISFKINNREYTKALSFVILKPFYLRYWFIIACALILGTAIYLIYRNRLQIHKKQNLLLLEKTTLEKDLRQSMLSSIKSQMNPHFLFNALNTIQSFIITEDKKNASVYLSKFSKLTRSILNMSEHETITLQEELDALLLYLELEKMRFNEINYSVVIDNSVNTNKILIPSMIIQPYVENSIKHGLLHKAGDKNLFIRVSGNSRELLIVIEDNGIGRDKSRIINQTKKEKHQSFASEANLKRIEILNQEKNKIGLSYEDKFDENQNPTGTKLTINIPIQEKP